jgi:hypothetical protein
MDGVVFIAIPIYVLNAEAVFAVVHVCMQVMTAQPHLQHSQLQAALAKQLNLRWAAAWRSRG